VAIDPALVKSLATANPLQPMTVFVDSDTIIRSLQAVNAAGLKVITTFDQVAVVAATGTPDAVRKVVADPTITYVEADAPLHLYLNTAHIATRAEEARHTPALFGPGSVPFDGTGVSIAINDSGVDGTHPMFDAGSGTKVGRNLRQACHPTVCDTYVDVDNSDIANGHGTHVAGIAAGYEKQTANGRTVRGAAPDATLVALGSGAGLSILASAEGLKWVLDNHNAPCGSCPPIKVVNNSWGPSGGPFNPSAVISQLSNALVDAGVTVVFAAGNGDTTNNGGDGSDNRVNPYAQNPKPGVIGVANYDDAGLGTRDGALNSSSSRGLKTDPTTYPDVAAPGTDILSACTYALPVCRSAGDVMDPNYAEISGTSMAAPYVSGVVAVLLEANPALTPAQIEDILEDNAYHFGAPADYVADPRNAGTTAAFDKGHGLIDVTASLGAVRNVAVPPGPTCGAGAAIVDAAGDATWVAVDAGLPGAVSEDTLDVVNASITTDAVTGALTFKIRVKDLKATPPTGAAGEFLRFNFTFKGVPYLVAMQRVGGSAEAVKTFNVQEAVLNGAVVGDVPGEFNITTDTISAVVPANVFKVWKPALPVIVNGDALSGLDVLAQRRLGVLTLTADQAVGACPYVVGT
jgi:serine protease AprX